MKPGHQLVVSSREHVFLRGPAVQSPPSLDAYLANDPAIAPPMHFRHNLALERSSVRDQHQQSVLAADPGPSRKRKASTGLAYTVVPHPVLPSSPSPGPSSHIIKLPSPLQDSDSADSAPAPAVPPSPGPAAPPSSGPAAPPSPAPAVHPSLGPAARLSPGPSHLFPAPKREESAVGPMLAWTRAFSPSQVKPSVDIDLTTPSPPCSPIHIPAHERDGSPDFIVISSDDDGQPPAHVDKGKARAEPEASGSSQAGSSKSKPVSVSAMCMYFCQAHPLFYCSGRRRTTTETSQPVMLRQMPQGLTLRRPLKLTFPASHTTTPPFMRTRRGGRTQL